MTFGEMQTEVFRRISESSSSPAFWTVADVKTAINEGYQEFSDASEWYERSTAFTLTNELYYNLSVRISDSILSIKRAFNDQTKRWLDPVNINDLDNRTYVRWEAVTGEPQMMILRGLWWLGMFPKQSAGTVTLSYSAMPPVMVLAADTPAIPEEFHYAFINYAVYDLLAQEAETDKALKFWGDYLLFQEAFQRYVQKRISFDRVSGFK